MSLEPNLAALVAASTKLTKSIAMPLSVVTGKRDAATTAEADIASAESAIATAATTATTDAATTASKLTTAAADYAAQKTTKGLAAVQTSADSELKDLLHRRDPARHPFRGARPSLVMDFVRRECHRNNAAGNLEPVDLSTFMTFTRASTATYIGPDGLIKEAASNVPRYGYDPVTGEALGLLVEEQRTNLLPYSMQFYMAGWGKTGVSALASTIISPAGDLTGGTVSVSTAGLSNISIPVTLVAGVVYTTSVYVKAGNTNVVTIRLGRGPTVLANADITLGTSAEAVHVGNGWYRCTITSTASDGTNGAVLVYPGGRTTQSVGNYVYVWGAQCEAGAFPTSYIPTPATFTGRASTKTYFDSNGVMQTAASGVAATDYGYVDGRWISKGLSLEGQATNVARYSSGTTMTGFDADTTTSTVPSTISGIALTQFLSSGVMARRIGFFGTALANGDVVASLYLKKQNGSVVLGFSPWEGSTSGATTINLDLTTGAGVLAKGLHTTAVHAVQDCGGLWRLSVALTYGAGNYTLGTFLFTTATTTDVTLGGLQAESGTVATSYIPTTTAQVTRAADTSTSAQVTRADESVSLSTMANWYSRDSSTFCVSAQRHITTGSNSRILTGTDSSFQEILGIRPGNEVESYDGTGLVCAPTGWDNRTPLRAASTLGRTSRKLSSNGANVVSGAASSKLVDLTAIKIWPYTTAQTRAGYIKQLTYFPRQLSDADLQALTILED